MAASQEPCLTDEEVVSPFQSVQVTDTTGSQEPTYCPQVEEVSRDLPRMSFYDLLQSMTCFSQEDFDIKYRYIRILGATNAEESQLVSQRYLAKQDEDPFFKCMYFLCGIVSAPGNLDYVLETQHDLAYQLERSNSWCLGSLFAFYNTAWTIYNCSEYSNIPNPMPYILLLLPKHISLTKEGATTLIDYCISQTDNITDFIFKPYFHITKCRWEFEQYRSQQALNSTHVETLLEHIDATIQMCKEFNRDWMIADSFGAKVSAVYLKLEIALCCFSDRKRYLSIKEEALRLLDDLNRYFKVNQAMISKYDKAWFLSVQAKRFRLEGNVAKAQECARNSAHRYIECGRNWRAIEEAQYTGDACLIKYCKGTAQPRVR